MQALYHQLSPLAFVKRAKDMRGRHHWLDKSGRVASRVPYKAIFLLRVMLMSNTLRSASGMKECLKHALSLILPQSLLKTFLTLLDECGDVIPAPATISRWRLVLDCGIMVMRRRRHVANCGNAVRYLQADSSAQHSRDFEHVVVCTVEAESLGDAMQYVGR